VFNILRDKKYLKFSFDSPLYLGKIRKEYYYITEYHLNTRLSVKLDIAATVIFMYKYEYF